MPSEYILTVRGKWVGVEVCVNDLPLLILEEGGNVPSAKINHLVIPGRNSVTLRVFLPLNQQRVSSEALATLRIVRDGQELYAFAWNADPVNATLPPETRGEFEAGDGFGDWQWQGAALLTLPLIDESGLHTLLEKVHLALSAKDSGGVLEALALKNSEMARSFGLDQNLAQAHQREFFDDLFSSVDWAVEPLNLTGVKYVLYGNERCVHTLTANDQEPLRSKPDTDGAVFSLPVLASQLKEGWKIVR